MSLTKENESIGNNGKAGWTTVLLDHLAEYVNGKAFKPKDWSTSGKPIIRIQNLNNPNAPFNYCNFEVPEKFHVANGDLLFAWSGTPGTSFGAHLWKGNDAVLNQHIFKINFNQKLIDKSFFMYALNLVVDDFIQNAHGTAGLAHITKKKFINTPIPLPPLPEQRRIVAKLDALMARHRRSQQLLEDFPRKLQQFRQSILARAVSGELTKDWRERNGAGEWNYDKAADACFVVQSGSTPKGSPFTPTGEIPYLKVYNIVNQKINFHYKPQYISKEINEKNLKRSIAKPGDVLMNIVGPPLGKIAIIPDEFPEWNLNQAITLFRPKPHLDNLFLYYYFCEGTVIRQIMPETRGSAGQKNISLSQCRAFQIPLPPLEEQKEIVKRVQAVFSLADRLATKYDQLKGRFDQFPQALLAKAFRGELVPQDPADEPAEDLLKRVLGEEFNKT